MRQRRPDLDRQADDTLRALQSVRGHAPEMSLDGTHATYTVDPPIGDNKSLTFVKIDGNWYLR